MSRCVRLWIKLWNIPLRKTNSPCTSSATRGLSKQIKDVVRMLCGQEMLFSCSQLAGSRGVTPSGGMNRLDSALIWRHLLIGRSYIPSDIPSNFLDWKLDLSSLPYFNLTALTIRRGDLDCQVIMNCNIDCGLELEGKCMSLHECNVTDGRGEKKRVSGVLSSTRGWPEFSLTDSPPGCAIAH